jgi:hypothetical protein
MAICFAHNDHTTPGKKRTVKTGQNTEVPDPYSWKVPSIGDARFTWEYDEGRARLLPIRR